ncbi:Peptidyl-tRNA hydrolase ArfB [Hyphomicrobiales bacterium]|nr:Peptidyl-tRNA hydrolase ArfB [Hyphomicrobiales bacterium]CAH1701744.1 Peptidyl-tRNA hydrolase ArfB [Hyphomicrobiales bacterium]CAI0345901.1 Peptidyl-tRNA hydrolase ArfB [Hyphomicrobiales bacterium]
MIQVTPSIAIDESEIEESFVRASGPGGQHVNKVSSAVQIRFDARRSPSLPNEVAIRLMKLAGSKLTQDGIIVIVAQTHRSQKRNREEAVERLLEMIRGSAVKPTVRRATKPTKASKERRLASKERRSGVKTGRQKPTAD